MSSIIHTIPAGTYDRIVSDLESAGVYDDYPYFTPNYKGKRLLVLHQTHFNLVSDEGETNPTDAQEVETEYVLNPSPACVVSILRRLDLAFSATGNDWAADIDGSQNDGDSWSEGGYEYEPRVETSAHLYGFTDTEIDVISSYVDNWMSKSLCL